MVGDLKAPPGGQGQLVTALTDRHVVQIVDIDRPDLRGKQYASPVDLVNFALDAGAGTGGEEGGGEEGGSGLSEVLFAKVTLTNAQLATLDTIPIELIPAPGADKVAFPLIIYTNTKGGVMPYTGFKLYYGDTAGMPVSNSLAQMPYQTAARPVDEIENATENLANLPIILGATAPMLLAGAIVSFAIDGAGTGYLVGDALTPTETDAVLTVATIGAAGEVLTATLTTPGTNTYVGAGQTLNGGAGTGATVNVTAVDSAANPYELTVKVIYNIFDTAALYI